MSKKMDSLSDRIFYRTNTILLVLFAVIIFYPLIYVVSSSFSDSAAVVSGAVKLWPVGFSLDGYQAVFKHSLIGRSFINSLFYTVIGTMINVALTLLAAYPLSRRDFQGRNIFIFMVTFTMLFSGGMIPDYLLVKDLNMMNSFWALIIPGAINAYNVVITRTYFQSTISTELLEAAQIDKCSDYRFFFQIAIPLSTPIIGVIALYYAVGHWNSWFAAMLYLSDPRKYPLQLVLRDILILNEMDSSMVGTDVAEMARQQNLRYLLKYAVIVVASVPMMTVYPFVQRYFVRGVMIGSLKG